MFREGDCGSSHASQKPFKQIIELLLNLDVLMGIQVTTTTYAIGVLVDWQYREEIILLTWSLL